VLSLNYRFANGLDDFRHVLTIDVDDDAVLLERVEHVLRKPHVDIVAAEMRVTIGREHLKDAVLDAQDRNVEGAAAEVVHGG